MVSFRSGAYAAVRGRQNEAITYPTGDRTSLRPPWALLLPLLIGALIAVGLLSAGPALALAPAPPEATASQASRPFSPSFTAGTVDDLAGAFSSEVVTIGRGDGEEELQSIAVRNPPGLLGMLSAVGVCSGVRAEVANCPAASRIGTVAVGLGPSFIPFSSKGGVYLTGPYGGAPFGLAIDVPVLVGPFDLAEVVSRATLSIDPSTAVLSIASDPLPQSLAGIPLQIRTIHLDLDRRGFILNPTSCKRGAITAAITSTSGQVASGRSPFRVRACRKLAFAPTLDLRLGGQTNRGGHPRLTTVMRMPRGGTNLRQVALTLPSTELVDSARVEAPCTRPQFAAGQCPPGSRIGFARVLTPLLKSPLKGPVYLRASNHRLPDLVVALHGQVGLDLTGRIDSVHRGLRVAFATLPDAPLSRFTLTLDSGRTGLLVNGADLCREPAHALAKLAGQNGAVTHLNLPLRAPCP